MAAVPWAFVPIALALTLTPGPATALVVRHAARGGPRAAVRPVVGNATGVAGWAVLSALGVAALVAVSEAAFLTLKVVGVAVLVYLRRPGAARHTTRSARRRPRATGRSLLTASASSLTSAHESRSWPSFFVAALPGALDPRRREPARPAGPRDGRVELTIVFDAVRVLVHPSTRSRRCRLARQQRADRRGADVATRGGSSRSTRHAVRSAWPLRRQASRRLARRAASRWSAGACASLERGSCFASFAVSSRPSPAVALLVVPAAGGAGRADAGRQPTSSRCSSRRAGRSRSRSSPRRVRAG